MSARVAFAVRHATTQAIPDAASATLTFDTVESDPHGFRTSATRYTIPTGLGGVYLFRLYGAFAGRSAGTTRELALYHSNSGGTSLGYGGTWRYPPGTRDCHHASEIIFLGAAGDYVEAYGFQHSAGAGNLNVLANVRLTGWRVPASHLVGFKSYKSGTQTANNNVVTLTTFDANRFDTHGFRTNSTDFVVPAGLGGVYHFQGLGYLSADATGTRRDLMIQHYNSGGARIRYAISNRFPPGAGIPARLGCSYTARCAAGDKLTLSHYCITSGANLTINPGSPSDSVTFAGVRIA